MISNRGSPESYRSRDWSLEIGGRTLGTVDPKGLRNELSSLEFSSWCAFAVGPHAVGQRTTAACANAFSKTGWKVTTPLAQWGPSATET